MSVKKTLAIIIKNMDIGEVDKLVTFYTDEFGKISGVAKGIRRIKSKFGNKLEPLTYGILVFFEKKNQDLVRINEFEIINSFQKIKEDLKLVSYSLYLMELLDKSVEGREKNQELFRMFIDALEVIKQSSSDIETFMRIFEIRLLSVLGYKLQLNKCVLCNNISEKSLGFSPSSGGIVCRRCQGKINDAQQISLGVVNFLKQSLKMKWENVNRLMIASNLKNELRQVLTLSISYHLEKDIKSLKFIDEVKEMF